MPGRLVRRSGKGIAKSVPFRDIPFEAVALQSHCFGYGGTMQYIRYLIARAFGRMKRKRTHCRVCSTMLSHVEELEVGRCRRCWWDNAAI
jgi:hypothetical protein